MTLKEAIARSGMTVYRFAKVWGLPLSDLYAVNNGRKAASKPMLRKLGEIGFDTESLFDKKGMVRSEV